MSELIRPDNSVMHDLKCWPEYFKDIESGVKTFDYRVDDRGFRIGDLLFLREWCPKKEEYTGRKVVRFVTYIFIAHQELSGRISGGRKTVIMAIVPFEHRKIYIDAAACNAHLEMIDTKMAAILKAIEAL